MINFPTNKSKNILITGRPRVGKSSLIKCCASWLGPRAGGFFTEEVQGEGIRGRSGFRLQTLDGQTGMLAEVDISSPYRLGRYGIHIEVLDHLAVPALLSALQDVNKEWILVDEIGKMEEQSEDLKKLLLKSLDSHKRVLASIRWHDSPFTRLIKAREDVGIFKLTVPNREECYLQIKKIISNQEG
ncbi:nucleoside-triphosphatase [Candidatus Protochlamydia phocaeensis]|uniref:nucleoside-triphosphatase n=1 Tax=Candidatus Protochlamydia phocaeensis TaxID=1414722 RepID=UPI0008391EC0|nr:nucleoside-triphosphatase [Candidatus Protochlamydia phocaeensis]